jgi:replicative superfamily II helicase
MSRVLSSPYGHARRSLRRMRVLDLLGEEPRPERELIFRDQLLIPLAKTAAEQDSQAESLPDWQLDAAVSVALARPDPHPLDALSGLALASQVLSQDGQVARLYSLSHQYQTTAQRLSGDRPALSAALNAIAFAFEGSFSRAEAEIRSLLGQNGQPRVSADRRLIRTRETMTDLLLANALRVWLRTGSVERIGQARSLALESGDSILFELSSLFLAFAAYSNIASLQTRVLELDPTFEEASLQAYLRGREVRTLFPSQLRALEAGSLAPGSKLIAMPTSSGKTLLAELRIAAQLVRRPGTRVVYLAPYRLLARQVEQGLRVGLRRARLRVRDLGGAYDISLEEELAPGELPDVAVMTPERMDALMRLAMTDRKGSNEARDLLDSISLMVFDEIHLIGRPGRGPRLELFLRRLMDRLPDVELFGLSAAVNGVSDLARWMGAESDISVGRRPTGTIELLWTTDGNVVQRFDERVASVHKLSRRDTAIDSAASLALTIRPEYFPVLLLETTRPNAEKVVRRIQRESPRAADRWREQLSPRQLGAMERVAEEARATLGGASDLPELILDGLAFHHAGVPAHLLRGIEQLVSERSLRVIGATTTVAEGAHLPFQVVVIPHLNFQGRTNRLEKDLYFNILGRAGRASVSAEGYVIILDSESATLRDHVQEVLWNPEERVWVKGQLPFIPPVQRTLEQRGEYRELLSQVLAWIGEHEETEDPSNSIANASFSSVTSSVRDRDRMKRLLAHSINVLEEDQLIEAASPYRLTPLGQRVALAGLDPRSCLRLQSSIRDSLEGVKDLLLLTVREDWLSPEAADTIVRLVFRAEEVLEKGLWLRRTASSEREQVQILRTLEQGNAAWPSDSELYEADIQLFGAWMMGVPFEEIGEMAPTFQRGLFSSEDPGARASDAADYLGRLAYPASWSWAAALAMLGSVGDDFPSWVRNSIEWGVPSHVGTELMRRVGLSRRGALLLSQTLDVEADQATEAAAELSETEMESLGLTELDKSRLLEMAGQAS